MIVRLFKLFLIAACATACVSGPAPLSMGIQPKYEAVNPSRILAVPPFVVPDPSHRAVIDLGTLETGNALQYIENSVLDAFRDQPSVNGVTFNLVRQHIGNAKSLLTNLQNEIEKTTQRLSSRNVKDRTTFSSQCIHRKNFIEFYVYCVATQKSWKDALNALSAKVLNADSALLVFVTEAEKKQMDENYGIFTSISAMLVDTNNGNLIWAREAHGSKLNPAKEGFPEWKDFIPEVLGEAFWQQFPGRKIKSDH